MSVMPLSRLLAGGRADETPVAERGGVILTLARFRRDVNAAAERIRRAGGRRCLLLTQDAYWGAVGLFAIVRAEAEAVVPPNTRPGVAATLAGLFDVIVTDTPADGRENVVLAPGEGAAETLPGMNARGSLTFVTSGSTGAPKQVSKTLAHLECEAEAIEALLGAAAPRGAKVLATVPHQHAYGLAFRVLWPLATGRLFVSETHELWEELLPLLGRGDALVTSPAHLSRMDGLPRIDPERRPCLVLSAGAPLAEADARKARMVFGLPVTEIFGSTETGAIASRGRHGEDPAWRPLPGVSIEATSGGLAQVRAAHVPDSGRIGSDRVEVVADGLRFLGRADRIVKIEGVRVDPAEITKHLREVALVADAAVTALGDPPEELGAVVALTQDGKSVLAKLGPFRLGRELRRRLAASREPASLPRRWRFVEALPMDALGKTGRAGLLALFGGAASNGLLREPETRAMRRVEGGADIDLFISPAIVYLDGHFPGFPIVPAVAQVDWAVSMAARHLGLSIASAPEFRVKFRKIMTPGMLTKLSLRHAGPGDRFTFEYSDGAEILSFGTIANAAP